MDASGFSPCGPANADPLRSGAHVPQSTLRSGTRASAFSAPPELNPDASIAASPQENAQKTARDFEAVFIGQMTNLMLESVETDGPFSGGHGEEMFRGVLAEKLGEEMARGRGIGIADQVMGEIIRLQQGGR